MKDSSTEERIAVVQDGDANPYIMVPVRQISQVRALLDADKIPYWVDEDAISLDGQPAITVVNLGHRADPVAVQNLLDSAS